MNRLSIIFLLIACMLLQQGFAQGITPREQLARDLQAKRYFTMRSRFDSLKSALNPTDRLYFSAFISNAFNQCAKSAVEVEQLMRVSDAAFLDTVRPMLSVLQIDNYVKTYNYKRAAEIGDSLIYRYGATMDSTKLEGIQNSNIIWRALAEVPAQSVLLKGNSNIRWKKDSVGLTNVPVTINDQLTEFIFDTGANISTINETYAKKLRLRLIETTFDLGSATSISTKASLGIADKLTIGNAELHNVVFLVVPDENLRFPQIHYEIHGIIGYPVISDLGEVRIYRDGRLEIPRNVSKSTLRNLAMDELLPILRLDSESGTLSLIFDTGAASTGLSKNYFDRFHDTVMAKAKQSTVQMGSAGGAVKYSSYQLPTFTFIIRGRRVTLTETSILTEPDGSGRGFYDGNIGQDLIAKFGEMIINFKDGYVDFK